MGTGLKQGSPGLDCHARFAGAAGRAQTGKPCPGLTRASRGWQDELAVGMYEEHVRYHVMCDHELCEEGANVADMDGFSPHLNKEQLNKVGSLVLGCRAKPLNP